MKELSTWTLRSDPDKGSMGVCERGHGVDMYRSTLAASKDVGVTYCTYWTLSRQPPDIVVYKSCSIRT